MSPPWIIDFDAHSEQAQDHPDHYFIRTGGPRSEHVTVSGHMGLANARLITAAPDLLAAAEALRPHLYIPAGDDGFATAAEALRQAVFKAKGGAA